MSASTDILHFGANRRKTIMLSKLGGKEVLAKAVETFYDRQVQDERLNIFFRNADLSILKWHYLNLMSIAFTHVPQDFDVERLVLNRHTRLFDEGLNAGHFDIVMQHFRGTLEDMKVDSELIQEAMDVILPVRYCFEKGAEQAQLRRRAETRRTHCVTAVILGTLAVALYHVLKNKRRV